MLMLIPQTFDYYVQSHDKAHTAFAMSSTVFQHLLSVQGLMTVLPKIEFKNFGAASA